MSEESQAPGKAWGLRKPWKGIYRQASQEALNSLSPVLFATHPVNGVLPITCCIFWVLNTIPLRPKLTAKAFSLSPASRGAFR